MFKIGFTRKDLNRVIWTAVFAAASVLILKGSVDKAALVAAAAAALSAVKNLVLADSSAVK